ncbi:MAG: hypothetical protein PHT07_02470 [Paludibacter sp.]|nr:hypothetical protein [Paludibacter sp.]
MKNMIRVSKMLQILVLLAFFLPFFPKGSEPKKAEYASTVQIDQSDKTKESKSSDYDENKITLSEKLCNKSKLFKILLRPNENYTGVGYSMDVFESFFGFGATMALVLFILGIIIKIKDYNSIFHFINIVAWIMLALTQPALFTSTKLWGYWVCLALGLLLVVYDTVVQMKLRSKPKGKEGPVEQA